MQKLIYSAMKFRLSLPSSSRMDFFVCVRYVFFGWNEITQRNEKAFHYSSFLVVPACVHNFINLPFFSAAFCLTRRYLGVHCDAPQKKEKKRRFSMPFVVANSNIVGGNVNAFFICVCHLTGSRDVKLFFDRFSM